MGYRKSVIVTTTEKEIKIRVCDVCGKDMEQISNNGNRANFYPQFFLEIARRDQEHRCDCPEMAVICSHECLIAYAKKQLSAVDIGSQFGRGADNERM